MEGCSLSPQPPPDQLEHHDQETRPAGHKASLRRSLKRYHPSMKMEPTGSTFAK